MNTFKLSDFEIEDDRDKLLRLAQTAEGAERYEDMRIVMARIAKMFGEKLTVEERNLLSVAFKNVVGARRASLRTLQAEPTDKEALIKVYIDQLQEELKDVCTSILDLLNGSGSEAQRGLIVDGNEDEAQVFYLKMGADYYRYLAECVPDDMNYPDKASAFYAKALLVAEKILPATHPIRLGLALNYSVCLYEISKEKTKACELAKNAFDEAISKLDKLAEADYKDSTLIMQLLRDNLTLWTANDEDDEN